MIDLDYLVISDIHLFHPRNKTADIIHNLDVFFDHYSPVGKFVHVKIIYIAGDIFDSLQDLDAKDGDLYTLWMERLMRFCHRHGIKLRILRGTPSHDWMQPKRSETIFKVVNLPLDFRYIDTLHIEYMEDLDKHVLYVPDEWRADPEDTYKEVLALMSQLNLTQVDTAIMHGCFRYQLPPAAVNIPFHKEEHYLPIVKHFINIGHHHTFNPNGRILPEGSFDRLSHNEEEPKGGVLCQIRATGDSYLFIENKGAKIFKTIELKSKDLTKSMLQVQKVMAKIPDNAYVRIKAAKDHPLYLAFNELKIQYPMQHFSKKSIDDEEDDRQLVSSTITLNPDYSPITINQMNIVTLVMEEVKTKHRLSTPQTMLLQQLLESTNAT